MAEACSYGAPATGPLCRKCTGRRASLLGAVLARSLLFPVHGGPRAGRLGLTPRPGRPAVEPARASCRPPRAPGRPEPHRATAVACDRPGRVNGAGCSKTPDCLPFRGTRPRPVPEAVRAGADSTNRPSGTLRPSRHGAPRTAFHPAGGPSRADLPGPLPRWPFRNPDSGTLPIARSGTGASAARRFGYRETPPRLSATPLAAAVPLRAVARCRTPESCPPSRRKPDP
jgi:hypothetical protein